MIGIIRSALSQITAPRFYQTERGFQGELVSNLNLELEKNGKGKIVVEQEYQKVIELHGLRIRPDIIIHVPFEGNELADRRQGNYVVFELKLRASQKEAFDDFEKLEQMKNALNYPLGVFINIASNETYLENYTKRAEIELHSFSVNLVDEQVIIREFHL